MIAESWLPTDECSLYELQMLGIIEQSSVQLSDILPADWIEENIVMGQPRPGPYRFSYTPYCREIVNRLHGANPAKWIAVMKGLQIGISAGVIIPGMVWIIRESPANTYFTVGAPDLINKSVEKLDLAIEKSGSKDYIKPQVQLKRNTRSGDTTTKKDFANGFINITTPNNHKEWRDVSLKYGFIDDFESAKSASKQSGSTRKLIEGRFAAYKDTHKIFYISTPEVKEGSNIEPAYLLGDQRKYMIPCPCCGEFIELRWNMPDGVGTIWKDFMPEGSGIVWELDEENKVIDESVGYVCQKCGGKFKDNNKQKLLNEGYWEPTAKPQQAGFYSYHISSLYAPAGMYDWVHYVHNYIEANPPGKPRNEAEHMTFMNTCLGVTYEGPIDTTNAEQIRENIRPYKIGEVPNLLSQKDGNGRIVLLTFACDLNGVKDDGRIDYEVLAHSESGSTYSIQHGSIGTFIPREGHTNNRVDRVKWTYEFDRPNSVWPELEKVMYQPYKGDDGLFYSANMPGIDFGHLPDYVWTFIDRMINRHPENPPVGLRGSKEEKYKFQGANLKLFEVGKARNDAYYLQVGIIKDSISNHMQLRYTEGETQPPNYMNYPIPDPEKKLYLNEGFFKHYESEHRTSIKDKDGSTLYRWVKKDSGVQNHFFDCRVYGMANKEIIIANLGKMLTKGEEEKAFSWIDYVNYVMS